MKAQSTGWLNRITPAQKTIFCYGVALAALVFLLKLVQYRYMVRDLSIEFYIGIVAVMFTAIGVWSGLRLTRKKVIVEKIETVIKADGGFVLDEDELSRLGISKREHEVLQLMSAGLSNQEIADKLFLSLNTVKTHSANLFVKLDVKRRTQAVHKGKELRLIA